MTRSAHLEEEMRTVCVAMVSFALMCGAAFAADPVGEWLVKDGTAQIRIEACANGLWGFISWTRAPATDSKNPDPAKQARPIVGVAILRAMTPVKPNRWEGEVYNADNGKMYSANIALISDDVLKIEGCVLGGLFCGSENWTRVQQQPADRKPVTPGSKPKPGAAVPPKTCTDG
jgi:uncharacterized protein (DUF2147 family)